MKICRGYILYEKYVILVHQKKYVVYRLKIDVVLINDLLKGHLSQSTALLHNACAIFIESRFCCHPQAALSHNNLPAARLVPRSLCGTSLRDTFSSLNCVGWWSSTRESRVGCAASDGLLILTGAVLALCENNEYRTAGRICPANQSCCFV